MWRCFETICVKSYRNQKYLTIPLWMRKLSYHFLLGHRWTFWCILHTKLTRLLTVKHPYSSRIAALCTYPVQPVCTSLLFILLFIKPQYSFFCHHCFVHLLFCTFYSIAHFTLISLFYHIYALVLLLYNFLFLLHCPLRDLISLTFHFWLYPV